MDFRRRARSPSILIVHEEVGALPRRQTRSPSVLVLEELPIQRGGPPVPRHSRRGPTRKASRAHPAPPRREAQFHQNPRRRRHREPSSTPLMEPPPLTIFPEEAPDLEVFQTSSNRVPTAGPASRISETTRLLERDSRSPSSIPPLFPKPPPRRQNTISSQHPPAKRHRNNNYENSIRSGGPDASRQRGWQGRRPDSTPQPGGSSRAEAQQPARAGFQGPSQVKRLMNLNVFCERRRGNYR